MKKVIGKIIAFFFLTMIFGFAFTSCATLPDFSDEQIEKFQKAEGTPEDSVVFYGFLPMNDVVKFKQIDERYPSDEQDGIKLSLMDSTGFWVSTPVKPGSTYMISYIKGSVQGGTTTNTSVSYIGTTPTYNTTTTFNDYVWDYELSEEYFVIKIPEKPGLYCFGQYTGREIMFAAQAGNPTEIFDQNNIHEKWGKNGNKVVINGLTQVSKAYKGTEWEAAALKEMEKFSEK